MTDDLPATALVAEVPRDESAIKTGLRRFDRLLRGYNPEKRPRQAFRLWTLIIGLIATFGVLGYAVPAFLAKVWK